MAYTSFDRFLAWLRFRAARPHVRPHARVCDIGCGLDAQFLRYLGANLRWGVGVDDQLAPATAKAVAIVQADITRGLPIRAGAFDHAVMLAVLEHLREPEQVLREAYRILAPGGSLIMTWPSGAVDPLLNVLHRVGMVSDEMESDEHSQRIPVQELTGLLSAIGFEKFIHRTFECGLNNLLVAHTPGKT
ncbi:MAG: class I SAM-dependent methyltransferase [Tepidisphaeraceae bacterium]